MGSRVVHEVRVAAAKRVLFLPQAIRQMAHPNRMISAAEVAAVVAQGELVEDYPNDPRSDSCLLLGFRDDGRPIHVVCSPKKDYLAIITAYPPDPAQWSADFKTRVP